MNMLSWPWWWFHGCVPEPKLVKFYTSNMYTLWMPLLKNKKYLLHNAVHNSNLLRGLSDPSHHFACLLRDPWVLNGSTIHVTLYVYLTADDHWLGMFLSYHPMNRTRASVPPSAQEQFSVCSRPSINVLLKDSHYTSIEENILCCFLEDKLWHLL